MPRAHPVNCPPVHIEQVDLPIMDTRRVDFNFCPAGQAAKPQDASPSPDNVHGCLPGRFCPCTLDDHIRAETIGQSLDCRNGILLLRIDTGKSLQVLRAIANRAGL